MASKTSQPNTKTVTAIARNLRISPRKLRLVTNLVKDMRVADALTQLQFTNKKAAPMVAKLLKSAIANAENNFSLNPDSLYVKSITCDMGKTFGRYFPRARGSAFVIRRKMAHVNVVLEERGGKAAKPSRLALLRKAKQALPKADSKAVDTVVAEEPSDTKVTQKFVKTDEQKKTAHIQQKRRLFNRKSGE